MIARVDKWTFWYFFSGVFKDHGTEVQNYFYFTIGLLYIGLTIEKLAINWLTNRWGCTYNKLQKFVELEMRKSCIKDKWERLPAYDIDAYGRHYFYTDFEVIKRRFTEEHAEAKWKRQKAAKGGGLPVDIEGEKIENVVKLKEVRDFVPFKVACRIRDFI